MEGGWSTPRLGLFSPGKDPVPIAYEAGWAPGPVWTSGEDLAPTEIRSPDQNHFGKILTYSKSLYESSHCQSCALLDNTTVTQLTGRHTMS